ncbi:hypothetical protein ACHAXT_010631 [Thalassiosira profunda]
MSDLAPFVAATLRDKVVSELLEEVQNLRDKEHALEYVEITGPNREPVYARGHLKDDGYVTGANMAVNMTQATPCPLQKLSGLELWFRNCFVSNLAKSAGIGFKPVLNDTLCVYRFGRTRAGSGIDGVSVDTNWTRQELESHVHDLPSVQKLLDGDRLGPDEDVRLVTCDLPQIDQTKLGKFSLVLLRRDLYD